MELNSKHIVLLLSFLSLSLIRLEAQVNQDTKLRLEQLVDSVVRLEVSVGPVSIDSIIEDKSVRVYFNNNLSYYPMRPNSVTLFKDLALGLFSSAGISNKNVELYTDGQSIDQLVPLFYTQKKAKSNERFFFKHKAPHIKNITKPFAIDKGLSNRHIALWQSHGYYYEPKLSRWEWQRARIFQTVEDLYTQSYVLPFLVPMLESAGAQVFLPRERDIQKQEEIIDNDGFNSEGTYLEYSASKSWHKGQVNGFAHTRASYKDNENPFEQGTYRQVESITKGVESYAEWIPTLEESGRYAVYVSYHTLPQSTGTARYTVHHRGGKTQFLVNQQMGGGTWVYLGTFDFSGRDGEHNKVVLSNRTGKKGEWVTADAVKIGGGMGNIARSADATIYPYEISGYPRFTEAARYWLQWAGIPSSIYTPSEASNDYTDDYQSRGLWVNYLSGGSSANPDEAGLGIPIDLAFAFHTDAGTTFNDSIIGTLGIFYTDSYDGKYATGASRYIARDLSDLIQSQIVDDIRALHHPDWTRRGMWNKAYSEASTPRVPTMLLELLSHQNFADMQYGLDPRFRFTVCRSIYKGMLKFLASQYQVPYVVQPLPVGNMAAQFISQNEVKLSWSAVLDSLESTATPTSYVVYKRVGNGVFDQGRVVKNNELIMDIPQGVVLSFKVTALNDGGESFPSEVLSVGRALNEQGTALIVNGFTRISAPDDFVTSVDSLAGFLDSYDSGVPYINDISYIGAMKEFRRTIPWMDDDASGFGDSYSDFETDIIAGNSFDYPAMHGASMLQAGYSFASVSLEAVERGELFLTDYDIVDLILGKQKQTKMGALGTDKLEFKTFSSQLQKQIRQFCLAGGSLFVSGAYIATDLMDNPLAVTQSTDKKFLEDVLKLKWRVNRAAKKGEVKGVVSPLSKDRSSYQFNQMLSSEIYAVESPDAIEPAHKDAFTIMRYSENNLSAAVAYDSDYKVVALGFPFETIYSSVQRDELMSNILRILKKTKE